MDTCIITWIITNRGALINSAGLLLDIAGAYLVASEVVSQYRGKKYKSRQLVSELQVMETTEFSGWEAGKYRRMKAGLACLTAGFLFQIASNWMR
ncbi:MAG: hypothetical protein NT047_08760 [Deltaproteobacteria bacterium]|nr:hypothetical protein [Deltaproteobacteria bacterium]